MKTDDGFPLLRPFNQAEGGIGYTLLGFLLRKKMQLIFLIHQIHQYSISVISLSSIFKMLDGKVQKLVELFSRTNRVGFRIWNLLDAQLIHSPFEVPVYKYVLKQQVLNMNDLIEKLKSHIHWEEGMDETMLFLYHSSKTYVKNATGKQTEYLIIMVAGIYYDYESLKN